MSHGRLRLVPVRPPSPEVARFVSDLAARTGLTPHTAYRLRLATDELTTNVFRHGYRDQPGPIELLAGVSGDLAWLTISDEAPPFDPRIAWAQADRHRDDDLVTRRPGGCGLLLVRWSLYRLDHEYTEGCNYNTLWVWRNGEGVVDATGE
ncbi:ATP-binding protein [Micromonospora sp. SCSIO 07396]